MSTITIHDMPIAVGKYFTAMNDHDSAAMTTVFHQDGLVNDIQREFWGPEAIRRWADRESIGDDVVTTTFTAAREHHGDYIVSAEVDGTYDKTDLPNPLVLTFYFSLDHDVISRLIILGSVGAPSGSLKQTRLLNRRHPKIIRHNAKSLTIRKEQLHA